MIRLLTLLLFMAFAIFPFSSHASDSKTAVFAGGCFWCMESEFEHVDGVSEVTSGYTGGEVDNPTYDAVSGGNTGHYEAVEVTYDPEKVSYAKLLDIFWSNVDPTDAQGQFCDKGEQYRAAIFTSDETEQALAEKSLVAVKAKFGDQVATQILPESKFWPAEDYHQDYYKKNATQYKLYRWGCQRDQTLDDVWGAENR